MALRLVLFACFVAACSVGPPGPSIDVDRALGHVAVLASSPRPGDSARSRAAYAYIKDQLVSLGAVPEELEVGSVDLPEIVVLGSRIRSARRVGTTDRNLIARFGPVAGLDDKALLVMAHYDTVPISPGAVDNAAAVAILIELAGGLHDHPPDHPVILAFTANEENGLVGGEALANQIGDRVTFAIALDLIGGTGRLTLNGASKLVGAAELRWLADAADRAGVELSAPLPHRVISRWWPQVERSDHGPFTRQGIRAVHFYDRGQDGWWVDAAYHTERDVPARVARGSVDEAARLLRALIGRAPPAHDGDGLWLPFATNAVVPRWTGVLAEVALAAIALVLLTLLILDHRGRPGLRGAGLVVGAVCYVVSVGAVTLGVPHFASADTGLAQAEIAEVCIVAGLVGLTTRLVGRFASWIGSARYLAIAIGVPLVVGGALLVVGAAELAWIWLVPAAVIGIVSRLSRAAPIGIAAALLPGIMVLRPNQLTEVVSNGFASGQTPVAFWIGAFGIGVVATTAWVVRGGGREPGGGLRELGPLGSLVLTMGCTLAVVTGVALML